MVMLFLMNQKWFVKPLQMARKIENFERLRRWILSTPDSVAGKNISGWLWWRKDIEELNKIGSATKL